MKPRLPRFPSFVFVCLVATASLAGTRTPPTQRPFQIYAFGHSHMDPAWRWRWWEGQDFVLDTFRQAVAFMREMPDFHYAQSQAALYAYVEQKDPALFEEVRKFVRTGQWQIVGGSWVENDANLPSGEGLVRQFLVGQRYFREKFGVEATTGWEPDCFGHTWALPQILRKSHIQRYVMLRGGKGVPVFSWQGPDGTRIPTVDMGAVLPALDDAFEDFQRLGLEATARKMVDRLRSWGLVSVILPFGVGDHGGGPTREMIFGLRAVASLPFVDVPFTAPDSAVRAYLRENNKGQVIRDELNYDDYSPKKPVRFVFQGCYSSHMRMKQRNYRDETLLTVAEKFGSLAEQLTGYKTPVDSLRAAWRIVLFNHFHDLLPGTAIHRAFEDAHRNYDRAERAILYALDPALDSLTNAATYPDSGYPVAVFNALGHPRTDVANVILDFARVPAKILFVDARGKKTQGQVLEGMRVYERFWRVRIGFTAHEVPAVGYKTYAVLAFDAKGNELPVLDVLREPTLAAWHPEMFDDHTYWKPGARLLKSRLNTTREGRIPLSYPNSLYAALDPSTGGIAVLLDQEGLCTVPEGESMGRLEILGDEPGGYTSWKMRLTSFDTLLAPTGAIQLLSKGPVCTKVRVPYAFDNSRFYVDFTVYRDLPRIDVDVHSYWRERLKTLKAVFPVATRARTHTRAIPFATIQRPNDGLEEPAQRWVDLSNISGGVAILNRNNPGVDVRDHTIRVTVLRSPVDPDPVADVGEHHARLAIYPHRGVWQGWDLQAQALTLSTPLLTRVPRQRTRRLPAQVSLATVQTFGVTLSAFKKGENGDGYVLRLVERTGKEHPRVHVKFLKPVRRATEVDMIEDRVGPARTSDAGLETSLKPYEVRTFRVEFGTP